MTVVLAVVCSASFGKVSIPFMKEKKFDGRGLRLVKILEKNPAYTKYYITYMSDRFKISGIMDVPKGKGPYPVIITAHGYIDPKVYTNGRGLKREQDYFARRGFVVLHPDYRNHAGSDKDESQNLSLHIGYTEDVINAVYAVKKSGLKFIDNSRIGLLGHSMGGLIGLNIMVIEPGLVNAYVLFAPMSIDYRDNFNRWILRRKEPKYGRRETAMKIIAMYGSPEANPGFWNNISVKSFVSDVTAPVQLHHGTADESVPYEWSQELVKALKDKGKDVQFYSYEGERHEFIRRWPAVMKRATEFFDRELR